jgi:serine/threonine protein kinase
MDMWALGVCVYMWCFGDLPFTGPAPAAIYDKIKRQDLEIPSPRASHDRPAPSHELLDFVGGLLRKEACERLDVVGAIRWVLSPLGWGMGGVVFRGGEGEQQGAVAAGGSSPRSTTDRLPNPIHSPTPGTPGSPRAASRRCAP